MKSRGGNGGRETPRRRQQKPRKGAEENTRDFFEPGKTLRGRRQEGVGIFKGNVFLMSFYSLTSLSHFSSFSSNFLGDFSSPFRSARAPFFFLGN